MNRLVSIIIAVFAAVLIVFPVPAHAENKTIEVCGFEMTECGESGGGFSVTFGELPTNETVENYAVSESGAFAISYNGHSIDVYDKGMTFLYSVHHSYSHCTEALRWQDEKLYIFVNSNTLFRCIAVNGFEDVTIYDIENTKENDSRFYELGYSRSPHSDPVVTDKYTFYIDSTGSRLIRANRLDGAAETIGKKNYILPAIKVLMTAVTVYAFIKADRARRDRMNSK